MRAISSLLNENKPIKVLYKISLTFTDLWEPQINYFNFKNVGYEKKKKRIL